MDLDALLTHFFGTADLDDLDDAAIEAGRDRASIAFGTERDAGRRFALWILLHATGGAPDPATAFKNAADRKAAEDYDWAARRMGRERPLPGRADRARSSRSRPIKSCCSACCGTINT